MGKCVRKRSKKMPPPATCLFCGLVLANHRNLVDHYYTHTEERPYSCNYCESTFRNNSIKIGHENSLHLNIKHKCANCKNVYRDRAYFAKHRKICKVGTKQKGLPKSQNKKKLGSKTVKVKRRVVAVAGNKFKPKPRSILTSKSDFKFKSKAKSISVLRSNLKQKSKPHLKVDLSKKNISDDNTPPIKSDDIKYPEYIWAHNGPPYFPPPLPPQLCQLENENKWENSMFFLHMNRYKEEDSMFSSEYKISSNNTNLDKNKNSPTSPAKQTGKKINKTDIQPMNVKCDPIEAQESTKLKENWTTDDTENLTCHQCGKMFAHRGNLARHAKIHVGAKPFICQFCNKRFSEKSNVIRHIVSVHQHEALPVSSSTKSSKTGKVKYSKKQLRCGFCGHTQFTNIRQLCTHILSDHNELLYAENL